MGLEDKMGFLLRIDFLSGEGSREVCRDGSVDSRNVRILNGLARPPGEGERDLTGGETSGRMTKAPLSRLAWLLVRRYGSGVRGGAGI